MAKPGVISASTLRTAFAIGGALIVVILVVALFMPRAIDMRSAAPMITAELRRALGQPVQVRGAITLSLVPFPSLILKDVVAVPSDGTALALNAEEVRADLSWGDLLLGTYDVSRLVLVRPLITAPWQAMVPRGEALPKLVIDRGQFKLSGFAAPLEIESFDADITTTSNGGVNWSVSGVLDGLAIESEGRITSVSRGGAQNLQMAIKLPEADVALQISGLRTKAEDRFAGRLMLSALHAGDALALSNAIDLDPARWPAARDPLSLNAELSVLGDQFTIGNGEAMWGKETAVLRAEVNAVESTFALNIELRPFDLMRWLPAAPPSTRTASEPQPQPRALDRLLAAQVPWRGAVKLNGQLVTLGAQTLRDAALEVQLENATWNVRNAGITLPGQTRMTFAGLWSKETDALEGTWRTVSADLRGLLGWVGVKPETLPDGSFTSFSATGTVQANKNIVSLDDLSIGLDASQATGRIAFGWDAATPTTVALDVDRMALDVYGPLWGAFVRGPRTPDDASAGYGVTPVAPWVRALAQQRGNVRVSVAEASWKDVLVGQLGVDVALGDNAADIRSIAFTDASGAALWLGGKLKNLDAIPVAEGLQFDVKVTDVPRFARSVDAEIPLGLRSLSPWTLNGAISGSLVEANMMVDGSLGPLAVKARSILRAPEGEPAFDGSFELTHPDAQDVRAALWPDAKFDKKLAGPVALTGRFNAGQKKTEFADTVLSFGPYRFLANGTVNDAVTPRAVKIDVSNIDMDWSALTPVPFVPLPAPGNWAGEVTLRGAHLKSSLFDARDFSARYVATPNAVELAEWSGQLFDGRSQVALKWAKAPDEANPARWSHRLQGQIVVNDANPGLLVAGLPARSRGNLTFSFAASGAQPEDWRDTFSGSGNFAIQLPVGAALKNTGMLAPLSAVVRAEVPNGRAVTATEGTGDFTVSQSTVALKTFNIQSNAYDASFTGSLDVARETFDLTGTLRLNDRGQISGPSAQLVLPPVVPMRITCPMQAPTIRLDISAR